MGWTSLHKNKGTGTGQWFRDEYNWSSQYEVIDVSVVQRTEVYIAVRIKETKAVFAFIAQVSYGRGYYNFCYKDMTEFCGPYLYNCPERILDLLTPLSEAEDPHGWAGEWRRRCRAQAERKKQLAAITTGSIIDVGEEISFTNNTAFRFFVREGKLWRGIVKVGDTWRPQSYVRINPARYAFTIAGQHNNHNQLQ